MNEEFKQLETEIKWLTDTVDANLEKQYNRLKTMSNKELRKEIENANWSYILQIIRYSQAKIEQLQQENKILKENAEHNDKVVDKVNWENMWLKKKIPQLKNNWTKLKEYIRKNIIYDDVGMKILDPSPLEDYMQKLEQRSDSNENN